jgi:hypothetical protein
MPPRPNFRDLEEPHRPGIHPEQLCSPPVQRLLRLLPVAHDELGSTNVSTLA